MSEIIINNQIVERDSEQAMLAEKYASNQAEFIAVYGRRRVGKTFLIRQFFEQQDCLFFQLAGIHNASVKDQLAEFTKELEKFYAVIGIKLALKHPKSWLDAFEKLTEAVKQTSKKVVLFFDEFPWMATKKSKLLQALDYYWNRYWVDSPNIKLIICGSAASWIIENILNNKAGLHNRVTLRLPIEPFNLSQTQVYLISRGIQLDHAQILQLYMCIGGIPYYLKYIRKGLSATQNINELCFNKGGALKEEFNNLFSSLFRHAEQHEFIVKLLAAKRNGVSRKEIRKKIASKGGALTRILRELEYAGFIEKFIPLNDHQRGLHYKLIDEYSLFYLNWISPDSKEHVIKELDATFWEAAAQSAAWKAWSGLSFEAICFKHLSEIRKALNIPSSAAAGTWQTIAKKGNKTPGAQIDLLFNRQDGIINICEIKYAVDKFKIDKEYAEKLKNKLLVYKKTTKTTKQLSLSMITTNGLQPSVYLEGLVWSEATMNDLFKI